MKTIFWKWFRRLFIAGILFSICCILSFPWILDPVLGPIYDRITGQKPVDTLVELNEMYGSFQTLSYEELNKTDLAQGDQLSKMNLYKGKKYLLIKGFDRYRYIVGKQRIYQFLPSQRIYRFRLPRFGYTQYLLLDKKAIDQLFHFREKLKEEGLRKDAFVVSSGFRPPAYNKQVGGKPKSRHLHGQAIDMIILDLNKDGRSNQTDVDLAYQLLDLKIVKSFGGLGRYKSNKRLLHLDARGYRARWHY